MQRPRGLVLHCHLSKERHSNAPNAECHLFSNSVFQSSTGRSGLPGAAEREPTHLWNLRDCQIPSNSCRTVPSRDIPASNKVPGLRVGACPPNPPLQFPMTRAQKDTGKAV